MASQGRVEGFHVAKSPWWADRAIHVRVFAAADQAIRSYAAWTRGRGSSDLRRTHCARVPDRARAGTIAIRGFTCPIASWGAERRDAACAGHGAVESGPTRSSAGWAKLADGASISPSWAGLAAKVHGAGWRGGSVIGPETAHRAPIAGSGPSVRDRSRRTRLARNVGWPRHRVFAASSARATSG